MNGRFWIGVIVLVLLLALTAGISWFFQHQYLPIAQDLELAARQGMDNGMLLARSAHQSWQHCRRLTAALLDHEPMDEIDRLFCQILYCKEPKDFPPLCAQAAELLHALGDSELPSWWNLL